MSKNPIFKILFLEFIVLFVFVITSVHIKTKYEDSLTDKADIDQNLVNFAHMFGVSLLTAFRMVAVCLAECYRFRNLRKRKAVKHNYQIMIMIFRKLIILVTILPLLWVSRMRGSFTEFGY